MHIVVPIKEPWRLPDLFPNLNSSTATLKILGYVGWFNEVPRVCQALSHASRAHFAFIIDVGIGKFIGNIDQEELELAKQQI